MADVSDLLEKARAAMERRDDDTSTKELVKILAQNAADPLVSADQRAEAAALAKELEAKLSDTHLLPPGLSTF